VEHYISILVEGHVHAKGLGLSNIDLRPVEPCLGFDLLSQELDPDVSDFERAVVTDFVVQGAT